MNLSALEKAVEMIGNDRVSGQSLLIYGLIMTINARQGGQLYLLSKLREMQPETRQLAYEIMDIYARGDSDQPQWGVLVEQANRAFQGDKIN